MSNRIGEGDHSDEGRGRTALVTGASSGLGWAMAELLAAKGYDVLAVARREDRLTSLADELSARWAVAVDPVVADLGRPEGAEHVLATIAERDRIVDLLVNNAGNSVVGRFETVPWATHTERLQLMGITTWRLTHGVLPGMLERGWGRVINISSIGAVFTGFPTDIAYNATKGMIERFSEGLDGEYRKLGIRCTVSLPGPTATEIFTHPGSAANVSEHPLFRHIQTTAASVARETYRAAMAGKPFVVPGVQYKPLAVVLQYAPRRVRRRLSDALCRVMVD